MANIKSAIKRIKITQKRTLRNKMVKSSMRTAIKKFEAALNSGNLDDAKVLLVEAIKKIDKAAAKGVIHANAAARHKSRLTLKLNKVSNQ
ncbi:MULTISPECIES: 30S ribosomal protein S20 [Caloramator]|jgi:small subunit ribosomal protein S20|uniref:Small ribosomal subunit protein bS20 n=1 Tax=Caloramator australicus RC3 TaxID=857293 RepID=I7KWA1_9CLOT|nr:MULTISPECIES: 30S ribosomal protein S20 [Caloramator]MDO6354491.1 30S ribosomal protein S20 [Caloramator sp. CAR-1]CCJ34394.1 SSU ribosomal protein S20p [Caloramator australicus RC3]